MNRHKAGCCGGNNEHDDHGGGRHGNGRDARQDRDGLRDTSDDLVATGTLVIDGATLGVASPEGIDSVAIGSRGGVRSWILTTDPIDLDKGDTVQVLTSGLPSNFVRSEVLPNAEEDCDCHGEDSVRVEIWLTDTAGTPVDPSTVLTTPGDGIAFAIFEDDGHEDGHGHHHGRDCGCRGGHDRERVLTP